MSSAHLKSEPMDTSLVDLESEILQLCRQYPQGVSNKIVEMNFQHVTSQQRLRAINRLLSLNKIDLLKPSNEPGTFLYRIRDTNHTSRSSVTIENGLTDQMEGTVYQIVKGNGNLGIGIYDIRFRTQLSQTMLNKILKILESKKLIKAVKSVHAKKKKVYMLYELTPDSTITGGIWYTDNEFEAEFARVLNDQCARLLDKRLEESLEKYPHDPFLQRTSSFMSSAELASSINEINIVTVSLTAEDIEPILNALIYDGKIEKMTGASLIIHENNTKQNLYRSIKPIMDSAPIVRNPCGICPIFDDCHEDGLITPSTCSYLTQWLDF